MFKDPFSFSGRIRRAEFALSHLFYYLWFFFIVVFEEDARVGDWIGITILFPVYLLLSQGTKRCHDLGKSGWWQLVPFYNLALFFCAGNLGPNQYGDNPKGEDKPNYDVFGYDVKTGKRVDEHGNELPSFKQEFKAE